MREPFSTRRMTIMRMKLQHALFKLLAWLHTGPVLLAKPKKVSLLNVFLSKNTWVAAVLVACMRVGSAQLVPQVSLALPSYQPRSVLTRKVWLDSLFSSGPKMTTTVLESCCLTRPSHRKPLCSIWGPISRRCTARQVA